MLRSFAKILLLFIGLSCSGPVEEIEELPLTLQRIDASAPNFILFIMDDIRYDALGFVQQRIDGRFPWVQTPTLDSLSAAGIFFSNAHVTTSLCSPSRASILTGQYAHTHQVRGNSQPFDKPSFASLLNRSGYYTGYFGKWHMGHQKSRPGFEYSYSYLEQGQYEDQQFLENGNPVSTYGWVDRVTTDKLIEKIQDVEGQGPFCYVLGFKSSHGPWNNPTQEFSDLYGNSRPGPTPNLNAIPPFPPEIDENTDYDHIFLWQDLNYFRYLTGIDHQIARVMEQLKALEMAENTYVIITSDNGFYMGEHRSRDKRTAYEESIKIPLIMNGPVVQPSTVDDHLVLNIDLAPTILELAGLKADWEIQGRSLIPLMKGETSSTLWRNSFVYQYFQEPHTRLKTDIVMFKDSQYKLTIYPGRPHWNEFYDLTNDPFEIRNLASDPNYASQWMEYDQMLLNQAKSINFSFED